MLIATLPGIVGIITPLGLIRKQRLGEAKFLPPGVTYTD